MSGKSKAKPKVMLKLTKITPSTPPPSSSSSSSSSSMPIPTLPSEEDLILNVLKGLRDEPPFSLMKVRASGGKIQIFIKLPRGTKRDRTYAVYLKGDIRDDAYVKQVIFSLAARFVSDSAAVLTRVMNETLNLEDEDDEERKKR